LEIRHLAEEMLKDPAIVQVNHTLPAPTISHGLFHITTEQKTPLLKNILKERQMTSTLVFTRTKHKAKSLALQLERAGFNAASLQGNLSQQKRQQALDGFRDGTYGILVATDIAARGIDVTGISHVINYDMPDTAETYTHRTGRTGRASRTGEALTFAGHEDAKMIALIERNLGKKMERETTPTLAPQSEEERALERRPSLPRQAQGKRPAAAGKTNSRRDKACGFDFGTRKPYQR
jgi:ATP-dependent RNA helicase RhlE